MNTDVTNNTKRGDFRRILGVKFFVGDAPEAVELGSRGGVVVAPAAPALMDLAADADYRQALVGADLVITDSGLLVLLWNVMKMDHIHRVSGLEYLRLLLQRPEFRNPGAVLWVMPSPDSMKLTVDWLKSGGYPAEAADFYVAPKYPRNSIVDETLLQQVRERKPRHIVIGLGGGVQEKLGFYLRENCPSRPAIHCIGAAIGFLSGDQVRIPHWADQFVLGWFFRCLSNPSRYVPRYVKALKLPFLLMKYSDRMPEPALEAGRK